MCTSSELKATEIVDLEGIARYLCGLCSHFSSFRLATCKHAFFKLDVYHLKHIP